VASSSSLRLRADRELRPVTVPPTPGAARPVGRVLVDPRGVRQWAEVYARSALRARNNPDLGDLECFCFFIGYARSGHTLVGTLLNAHPDMVISHELDAVRYVRHRFSRSQLVSLILERDHHFGEIDRTWSGYDYAVPDQFQGKVERLRVLGDKRARAAVLQLAQHPRLLDRLRRVVKVPIRVVHVTRNPFDNIATEARRHNMSLAEGAAWYEQICEAVSVARPLLDPSELIDVRYEEFAADPGPSLAVLCGFLGVEPGASYLDACSRIVWPSTNRTRDTLKWSEEELRGVERLIGKYETLGTYTFDH
jgi:hypothetical protein